MIPNTACRRQKFPNQSTEAVMIRENPDMRTPNGALRNFHFAAPRFYGREAYLTGTTAPSKLSLMYFLISSLFRTSTSALMSSRFSSPLRTAMMFA